MLAGGGEVRILIRFYLFRRFIVPWGFITLLTLVCWALAVALSVALMSCDEAPTRNWYSPAATTQAEAASSNDARSVAFTVIVTFSLSSGANCLVLAKALSSLAGLLAALLSGAEM